MSISTLIRQQSMCELRKPNTFADCLEEMEINTYDYVFRQGIKGWNKKYHQFLMLDLKAYMVKRFQGRDPHYSGKVFRKMWFSPVNFAQFPNYYHYPEEIKYGENIGQFQMIPIGTYTDEWIKYQHIPFIQEYYKEKTGQENPTKEEYKKWGYTMLPLSTYTNFKKMYASFEGEQFVKSEKYCCSRRVVRRTLNYGPTPMAFSSVLNFKYWDKTTKKTSLKGLKAITTNVWSFVDTAGNTRTGGWKFGGFDAGSIEVNAIANGFKKVKGEKYYYGHYAEFLLKC